MTSRHAQEIAANLERAEKSIQAARELSSRGYYDVASFVLPVVTLVLALIL
jgi:hypothetical protein